MEINVNRKSIIITGSSISIDHGQIIVDGKSIETGIGNTVHVTINGDVGNIQCSGSVTVNGSVK